MRTLSMLVAMMLLAGPATAAGEVELLEPCSTSVQKVTLDDLTTTLDTPGLPAYLSETSATFVLDLAGNPVDDDTARVDVTVSWDDPVSDFDTSVNEESSRAFTFLDGPADHYALGSLEHCSLIAVGVENFSGNPLAVITADFNVR